MSTPVGSLTLSAEGLARIVSERSPPPPLLPPLPNAPPRPPSLWLVANSSSTSGESTSFSNPLPMAPPSPSNPPLVGLAALSEIERDALKRSLMSAMQEEAAQITRVENSREALNSLLGRGVYESISSIDGSFNGAQKNLLIQFEDPANLVIA